MTCQFARPAQSLLARISAGQRSSHSSEVPIATLEVMRVLLNLAVPYRTHIVTGAIMFGVAVVLQLPIPVVTKYLIDRAVPSGDLRRVDVVGIGLLAVVIVQALAGLVHRLVMIRLHARVQCDLRMKLLRHVQSLPIPFFKRQKVGYLHARLSSDAETAQGLLGVAAIEIPWSVLTLMVGTVVVLWLHWKLAVFCLGLLPVYCLVSLFSGKKARCLGAAAREGYALVSKDLQEVLSGTEVIKSFTCEELAANRVRSSLSKAIGHEARYQTLVRTGTAGLTAFSAGTSLVVLWVGCREIIQGGLSLGGLIAFTTALRYLFEPAAAIASRVVELQQSVASAARIVELLRLAPETNGGRRVIGPSARGALELKDVDFGYERGHKVLDKVSFSIAPGEQVAIVGKSGAGKSTIVALILRFLVPWAGQIRIDGMDIREVELESLRKAIACVPQDTFLFSDSVLANIKIGNPSAPVPAVLDAGRTAGLHGLKTSLGGYSDREVGDRGRCLSGGERQRVAIARALLKNAPLLIFDEATSEVDAQTDAAIHHALYEVCKGRTVLIIAHRLSTVIRAHRIVVLEGGRVVDTGTHYELMGRCGAYSRLCEAHLVPQPGGRRVR